MKPSVHHVQITVRDMAVSVPFYDRLMPRLGLQRRTESTIESHALHVVEYSTPRFAFAISSPRASVAGERLHRRRPGSLHHLAFRADSRAEVDRLYGELRQIGATIVSPPRAYAEYVPPGYYAVFFKDPDGIKYEIVHTPASHPPTASPSGS